MSSFRTFPENHSPPAGVPHAIRPESLASWRADLAGVLHDALEEIRSIEDALRSLCSSSAEPAAPGAPPAQEAPPDHPSGRCPPAESLKTPAMQSPAAAPTEDDFDARLARLKRRLAEKLTHAGPANRSRPSSETL